MHQIKYRPIETSDQDQIKRYIQSLYADDPDGKYMKDEQITRTFEWLARHPDMGTILVFDTGKEIIGYAILVNFWSNEYGGIILVIDELYIIPPYRSQGIGKHFISYLKASKFNDCIALELEVLPYNTRALKLYQQLGFKKTERDFLLMEIP